MMPRYSYYVLRMPCYPPVLLFHPPPGALFSCLNLRRPTVIFVGFVPFCFCFFHSFAFQLLDIVQAVVTGVVPSSPRFLPSILSRIGFSNPTARRFFIECVANSALALSASQFVLKKKALRIYTTRVCTRRGDSNSRNWPITGPRIT